MKNHSLVRKLISAALALVSGSTVVGVTAVQTRAEPAARKAETPHVTACSVIAHRILA